MQFRISLGVIAIALASLAGTTPGAADERWCATYGGRGGAGVNCGFYSLEQCRAAISGNPSSRCDFDYFYQQERIKYGPATKRRR